MDPKETLNSSFSVLFHEHSPCEQNISTTKTMHSGSKGLW